MKITSSEALPRRYGTLRGLSFALGAFVLRLPCIGALFALQFIQQTVLASPPDWVASAAASATSPRNDDAPAIVLRKDTIMEVAPDGTVTLTRRSALKILTAAGVRFAAERLWYNDGADEIVFARSWLVRSGREVKPPAWSKWQDIASDTAGALHRHQRYRTVDRNDHAAVGDVFAAEIQLRRRIPIAEVMYPWLGRLPVLQEDFVLLVPPGFSTTPVIHGEPCPTLIKTADGRRLSWTLRDDAFRPQEPFTPSPEAYRPWIHVNIAPPASASQFAPVVVASWSALAASLEKLTSQQCDSSAELVSAGRRLVAGHESTLSKIQSLTAYVQTLRSSIEPDWLESGFDFQAPKASDVFREGYGNRQDKANLLRALLRSVGINAYSVVARADADVPISPGTPSPSVFNHTLIAVPGAEGLNVPAVVPTERWGSLLFIDPSIGFSAVGELPLSLQGTPALLLAPGSDGLITLPRTPTSAGHILIRRGSLELATNGDSHGEFTVEAKGHRGAELHQKLARAATDSDREIVASTVLGGALRSASLNGLQWVENIEAGICRVAARFSKQGFAQPLAGGALVVNLNLFSDEAVPRLTAPERYRPVKMLALGFDDEIHVNAPGTMEFDALPDGISFKTRFGSYSRSLRRDGAGVIMSRRLELAPGIVPAADYAELTRFISRITIADRLSLLLQRRP